LDAWQDEAPKLVQNADLLPRTRKAITRLLGWYGAVCLDKDDDIVSVREAFDLITQIGADSPDTLDHLAGLTVTLHHRQADETSEILCQDLLERAERILGVDHAQSHIYLKNLAFLRMCRGKLEEAKCLFQRALETHLRASGPATFGSIDAKISIAECLLMQGRMEEARQFIRDFAQKLPTQQGDASPCKTLASVLNVTAKRQKNTFANYGAARICYDLSLEFDPGSTEVHSNFALLLWACLHEHDEADLHFRRSLQLNARNHVVHGIYGLFLGQERDDVAGAIEHFEKAEALNPYDPATMGNHASVLLVSGNIDAAWSLTKQAMRFCRQSPDRMMCRALFDGAAALLLLDRSPSVPLGQLKTLFARRIDHAPWVITALLKKLQEKLSPASFALVAAVSAAIDDKEQLARLQQNRAWQAIKALPLDFSWPEI
jgi:tetratricopeptide (TPR) repeat protein